LHLRREPDVQRATGAVVTSAVFTRIPGAMIRRDANRHL
jgi:hypothetical protein